MKSSGVKLFSLSPRYLSLSGRAHDLGSGDRGHADGGVVAHEPRDLARGEEAALHANHLRAAYK